MPASDPEPTPFRRLLRWWHSVRVEVRDPSMVPLLRPGDRLRVDRSAFRSRPAAPGDIVVVVDPEEPGRWLVKRVGAVVPADRPGEPGCLVLVSDRSEGARDSRAFGPVRSDRVVGRPYLRYAPPERRGPV